jgi:5-formyltetrahydrofolate cyclo-ligase
MTKAQLREKYRALLKGISGKERSEKSKLACSKLIATPQFRDASVIMMFLSLPSELDTSEAIRYAWKQGKIITAPKVLWKKKDMVPVRIDSLDNGFKIEESGLRNPITNKEVPVEEIDLVVIPALVFDREGCRVGRGGGYYDKFLANSALKAIKCGFGYAEQLLEDEFIPAGRKDVPLDLLVTDKEVLYFSN